MYDDADGTWHPGPEGFYCGSTYASLKERFEARRKAVRKVKPADALVSAMRIQRGRPRSRFVLRRCLIEAKNEDIIFGAIAVVRAAEWVCISHGYGDSACMNKSAETLEQAMSTEEAIARGAFTLLSALPQAV